MLNSLGNLTCEIFDEREVVELVIEDPGYSSGSYDDTWIIEQLEKKVDRDGEKQLTDVNFSQEDKDKLDNNENQWTQKEW